MFVFVGAEKKINERAGVCYSRNLVPLHDSLILGIIGNFPWVWKSPRDP